jgi:myosin-5
LQELAVAASTLNIRNPNILEGVDDMTTLSYLHEPAILHNLQTRYSLNIIYTFTGTILIAVNPYCTLNIYSNEMIEAYRGQILGKLPPHVFAMGEDSFRSMINEGTNQSILVSGESGAGKTETTKFLLQYFAAQGSNLNPRERSLYESVSERVLSSTPLLEAFGNAKTIRNDNSSRFGKFMEIQFQNGIIVGSKIRTYLLEKSRIVHLAAGERNYHIFYQLCAGAEPDLASDLSLASPDHFNYLNQGAAVVIDDVSDAKMFAKTRDAMRSVGIAPEEQRPIFQLLAGVLHLGNVSFAPVPGNEDSCQPRSKEAIQTASRLLGCEPAMLEKYLCSRHMITPSESYWVPLTAEQASTTR